MYTKNGCGVENHSHVYIYVCKNERCDKGVENERKERERKEEGSKVEIDQRFFSIQMKDIKFNIKYQELGREKSA
jgi:hypothetical protein